MVLNSCKSIKAYKTILNKYAPFTDRAYRIGKIYFIKNSFKFDKMKGTKKSFWRYSSSENFHSNANDHYEHINTNIMNQEG